MTDKLSKRSFLVLLVLFSLVCCNAPPPPPLREQPTIEYRQANKVTTITFNEGEMKRIDEVALRGDSAMASFLVSAKMAELGVKCCEPRKRLDQCTWECCDRSLVVIVDCNSRLQLAMREFGSP
jgi:hypothetical protein